MNYALLDIPRINPNYASRCDFKANRVICSAAGQIKILNCDPAILTEVLQNVDGNTAFGEIERRFCDRYPLESIRSFLNILLEEGIIEKAEDKPHSLKHANVLVIGEGSIFNSIVSCSGSNSHLSTVDFLTTDSPINYDAAIFAPGIATNEEMLAVNKKLYYIDKPFIAFFCNGEKLVAGPLVVPCKSACLECVLSHEIKWLNSKLSKDARIKTQDVLSLRFSCELPSTTSKEVLAYISSCVMTDLEKYNNGDVSVFLDKQFYFELNEPKYTVERVNPTTSCDFCSGMNKKYVRFDPENTDCVSLLNELLIEDAPELTKRNIKYRVGGFRSASETETMSILQTELKKFGAKVRVEPAIGNPFNDSDTIHCFNSFIEQTSNAEIPFLFRKNEGAGKGLTETQSFFSAAFELLEHAGLQYAGDVPIVCAKYKDVQNVAIDMPYLASMIKNPNTAFDNFDENEEIDWVVATSVTDGSHKLVPAFMAFLYDVELKGTLYAASSNGAAIATSVEDAILHGLLESIERDAWLLCQSNPYILPILDYSTVQNPRIKEIIAKIKSMGYDVITRDYTTDLEIPVYRTWIVNKNDYSRYAYNGLGCHVLPELALERSITEAVQVEDWSDTGIEIAPDMLTETILNKSLITLYNQHFLVSKDVFGEVEKAVPIREPLFEETSSYDILMKIAKKVKEKTGGDVYYINLTKPGMDVKIVRTVITGDFQKMNIPLIAVCNRMFEFGINCGYSDKKNTVRRFIYGAIRTLS